MRKTWTTHLKIPLTIAESIHLLDAPASPIRAMLIAESEREDGANCVSIPFERFRALGQWTVINTYSAIAGMAALQCRWRSTPAEPDVPPIWSPFVSPPVAGFEGDDERVQIRFAEDWLVAARGPRIEIPLDEIHAMRRRAAILLRLRLEAALHGRETAKLRWPMTDLGMLSGRGGDLPPMKHLMPDIAKGIAEVSAVCSTIAADMSMRESASGRAHSATDPSIVTRSGRTRGVVITARRLHARTLKAPALAARQAVSP